MTMVSSRWAVLRFCTAGGVATFLTSFLSIQAVVAISAKVDLGFSGSFVLLGAQVALLFAVCSAVGAALGWRNGGKALPSTAGAVLVGVAAALFVVVAAIVTAVALVPELWVVLWIVTVPAGIGGLAAALSVHRLQHADAEPAAPPRLTTLAELVLDRLRAPDEVLLHDPRHRRAAARRSG